MTFLFCCVNHNNSFLPLTSLIVFMVGFSVGFGCIPFLLMGEIFPSAQRSLLSSIAGSFNLAFMFIVIKTYHYLENVSIFSTESMTSALLIDIFT